MKRNSVLLAALLLMGCANLKFQASASYMNDAARADAEQQQQQRAVQ